MCFLYIDLNSHSQLYMEDFFGDSGETAVQQDLGQTHFQSQDNGPDD